ncbi:MAG TPA: protein kinase [Pirellulales bacterium]|nr:protein kinase [Pirellulales bacterium]
MNADRNLLFGLLALQLNFVDRHQLVSAFDRWTLDKAQPLAQILQSQGALSGDRLLLLEALVSEHLKVHDNDPQKSLADLTPVGSARDELHRLADGDVQASLAHVSIARGHDARDLPSTLCFPVGTPTSAGTRFRVLRPHARGGLGEVYVAVDEELHREVALKEIQKQHADEPESRTRFLLEAEITGGLEHPGIVPVYGLGTYADGRPFYAMRFIRGDSLKEAIEQFHSHAPRKSSNDGSTSRIRPNCGADGSSHVGKDAFSSVEFRKLLGRFIDVCNAIEYAHSRGVLHRDLKPGNIMLGKYGETLVVDWGLAKVVGRQDPQAMGEESTLRPTAGSGSTPTEIGRAVGTPQFMSPEQAEGRIEQLGPASDVYSLGATLYTLLTGQPPFSKDDTRVVGRVARGQFSRPRELNPEIPQGLEAVCLKAMALEPTGRYESPRALADDIEHWLADEPVSALDDTFIERAARWTRRHRAVARSAAAALLTISVVSVAAALFVDQARRDEKATRQLADSAAKRADQQRQNALAAEHNAEQAAASEKAQRIEVERQSRISNVWRLASQSQVVRSERPVLALLLALEALELADDRHTASITSARQALRDGLAEIGGLPLLNHSSLFSVANLTFSSDGRWLAAAARDEAARLWDLKAGGAAPRSIVLPDFADGSITGEPLAFSRDGQWLAHAGDSYTIRLLKLQAADPLADSATLRSQDELVERLEFSPDNHWLLCIGLKKAHLWNLTSHGTDDSPIVVSSAVMKEFKSIYGELPLGALNMFSPDSRWLVTTSADGTKSLWDLRVSDRQPTVAVIEGEKEIALAPTFSSDGRWLAAASGESSAYLYDLTTEAPVASALRLQGHHGRTGMIAFSANNHWLAIGSDTGARLWELTPNGPSTAPLALGEEPIVKNPIFDPWFIGFSPDNHWLVAVQQTTTDPNGDHKTARLWDLSTKDAVGNPITLDAPTGANHSFWTLRFSPDGHWLAEEGHDTSRVWDLTAADPPATAIWLRGHTGIIQNVAFSQDGKWLATGSHDSTARVWNLTADQPAASAVLLRGHDDWVAKTSFSPDGQWLATAGRDGEARLWDLAPSNGGAGCVTLPGQVFAVFSLDGRWLATMTPKNAAQQALSYDVLLWDRKADDPYARAVVFRDQRWPAFSADGHWLATAGDGGELQLWDLTANDPAAAGTTIAAGVGLLHNMAFSADGRWLGAVRPGGLVSLWDLAVKDTTARSVMLNGCAEHVHQLDFSVDGRWLGTGSYERLQVWDLSQQTRPMIPIELDTRFVFPGGRLFSANGNWLVGTRKGEGGSALVLSNLKSKDLRDDSIAIDDTGSISTWAFSHNDRWLATADHKGTIRLTDMATGHRKPAFEMLGGHRSPVLGIAFSPDGRWLNTWAFDGDRLWDLTADDPASSSIAVHRHTGHMPQASPFSPDGLWLAGYGVGGIRLWPLAQEELVRRARAVAGRELTIDERSQYLIPKAAAYITRAHTFATDWQWDEVIADVTRAAELDPAKAYWPLYWKGVSQLANDDAEGYKQTWRALYEQFKDAEPAEAVERIVRGYILGNPEPKVSAEIVRMARFYAQNDPAGKRLVGGALLRDGQYAAAVEVLTEAARQFPAAAWDQILLAMAQQKSGQTDEALATHGRYLELITGENYDDSSTQWWEQCEADLLTAEFQALFDEAGNGE